MWGRLSIAPGLALAAALALSALAPPAEARERMVVELFTSQSCEECWRANQLAAELTRRPEVLVLTFPVGYWDHLGWKDTFARPEFAGRQRFYKRAFGLRTLQTPQMIVDGRAMLSGLDRDKVFAALRPGRRPTARRAGVAIVWDEERVLVGSGRVPFGGADVWLVRYDPASAPVTVTRGPNRGRTVPHRNVVRQLVRLGPWTGRGRAFALPPLQGGLRQAVIVQALSDGAIIAVEAP